MSNQRREESLSVQQTKKTDESNAEFRYRWSYEEQYRFDKNLKSKTKKSGALVYALVMTAVFLLCLGLLVASLIWYRSDNEVPNTGTSQGGDALGSGVIGDVAEAVKPCTVLIYAQGTTSYSYGTGFFIDPRGYIATNYHVVQGATRCTVTLYSGEELDAELIGYKESVDLAVLKIKGKGYPVLPVGDSSSLRVGELAIAVGNPAGDKGAWSTTAGIISALDRSVTVDGTSSAVELKMIQTDASLNPGNSGGPLCNAKGQVIGVVSRKMNDAEGISYALPINGSMQVLLAIVKNGNADDVTPSFVKERPLIGITCGTIQKGDEYTYDGKLYHAEYDGVFVSTVNPNGAAYGKLKVCDIVVKFDGKSVDSLEKMTEMLYDCKAGERVELTVCRDGELIRVTVKLGGSGS